MEIEIEYMKRKTKISLPENYEDFRNLIKKTFFITDKRLETMFVQYNDEDNDVITLDSGNYSADARKAKILFLKEEEPSEPKGNINLDELKNQKIDLENKIENYKKQYIEHCSKVIEEGIKKRIEDHKENKLKIKKKYLSYLNSFKEKMKTEIGKLIKELKEVILKTYDDNLKVVEDNKKEAIKKSIDEFKTNFSESFDKNNQEEISKQIEDLQKKINDAKFIFLEKSRESKASVGVPFIIQEKELRIQVNSINKEVKFKLNIKKRDPKKKISKAILDLTSDSERKEIEVKLTEPSINVTFTPKLLKQGDNIYEYILKENEENISNPGKLTIVYSQMGDNEDIFN
jgi:hypothetical protein